jgi:hypothetical protein
MPKSCDFVPSSATAKPALSVLGYAQVREEISALRVAGASSFVCGKNPVSSGFSLWPQLSGYYTGLKRLCRATSGLGQTRKIRACPLQVRLTP